MNNIKLFDLKRQYKKISPHIKSRINKVLESGQYIMGPNVISLESKFREALGSKYAISCNSGTDALLLSLRALGIGQGDEVITTAFTYFATAEAILLCGAKPVFVDINPNTYNIDEVLVEKSITRKTKAIIPVHIFGQPARVDVIKKICKKNKLSLIEDCAQSYGATIKGKNTGTFGEFGCFSFFPTKNLGCAGDGGMVVTNNKNLSLRIQMLRNHGGLKRNIHDYIGYNSRLDEIQAAILIEKMKIIKKLNIKRNNIAKTYFKLIKNKHIILPTTHVSSNHVYHQFTILTQKRASFLKHLSKYKIPTGLYYPKPIYSQNALKDLNIPYKNKKLKNTELVCKQCVSLPMYPELTKKEIKYICDIINEFK